MKTIDIYNRLTSLKGSPRIVKGNFNCNHNNLTNLEGAPTVVIGDFYCDDNKLTNLKGAPRIVRFFFSWNNKLISLDFLPVKRRTI